MAFFLHLHLTNNLLYCVVLWTCVLQSFFGRCDSRTNMPPENPHPWPWGTPAGFQLAHSVPSVLSCHSRRYELPRRDWPPRPGEHGTRAHGTVGASSSAAALVGVKGSRSLTLPRGENVTHPWAGVVGLSW